MASQRGKPDITPPFGFNRIITPHNYESRIIDLLGVKYVLSLTELKSDKLKIVFQEGDTRIYENIKVLPRAFFVKKVIVSSDKRDIIAKMFDERLSLSDNAFVESENNDLSMDTIKVGKAIIDEYSPNKIIIHTENTNDGFLVLTDTYYPIWHARIDGKESTILKTDYTFRGIFVPKGEHEIVYSASIL